MISYCIAVYRPIYARLLISDLCLKTAVPFEILVWLNVDDRELENLIAQSQAAGYPVKVVGKTPENIGMAAYGELFRNSRFEMITQIDDDVVCVSRGIAEMAHEIFRRFPAVRQLTSDVWQDEYTSGAKPDMNAYRLYDDHYRLFQGPIDGWFSIYHRSILPMLVEVPREKYLPIGGIVKNQLRRRGLFGLLCTRFRVFHVIGPAYSSYFEMIDFEINKYRQLGRIEIVSWYENERSLLPAKQILAEKVESIFRHLDATG